MKTRILTAALAMSLVSWARFSGMTTTPPTAASTPSTSVAPDALVGRFASENPGSVNVYWFGVPDGLVVVDAGRNETGGRTAATQITATERPVVAILITHPHPDHVGGLGALHEAFPDAPIYASTPTIEWMRSDPLGFYPLAATADPDFPAELTYPDHPFTAGTVLDIGGAQLQTSQFAPAESQTATAYYEPQARLLFSGDLTDDMATPALLEGHTCGWLTQLDVLQRRYREAATIYPGHGQPGDPHQQIDAQRTYLQTFRALVRTAVNETSPGAAIVTADESAAITAEVERRYPDYPPVASLPNLQQVNIDAVATELSSEAPGSLAAACQDVRRDRP